MEAGIRVRDESTALEQSLPTRLAWSASLAAVWAAAGGTAGGALIALLLLVGRMHSGGSATSALLLSLIGGCLGLIHGAMLGRLSSAGEPPSGFAARAMSVGAGIAALLVAAALSLWLAASAVLARSGRLGGWVALLAGAAVAVALAALATHYGWIAFGRAWGEWQERRLGTLLVAGAFAVLATVLLVLEPALPGVRGSLTTLGWLIVAALATLWIATPLVVLTLRTAFRKDQRLR
jgi:hypothetical protein